MLIYTNTHTHFFLRDTASRVKQGRRSYWTILSLFTMKSKMHFRPIFSVLFSSHTFLCDCNVKEERMWKRVTLKIITDRQDGPTSPRKTPTLIFNWLKTWHHVFIDIYTHVQYISLGVFVYSIFLYTYFIHVLPVCLRYTLMIINRGY